MKNRINILFVGVTILIGVAVLMSCSKLNVKQIEPIHLDDIHFIVTDENESVAFFEKHFGAKEMAHPGDRFDLVRFLSLKWQGPTITITPVGPYPDLPPDRNKRWLDAKIITPKSEQKKPVYGVKWLALSTPSLEKSKAKLINNGVQIFKDPVVLPLEKNTSAFSIYGPDGMEIVIVERSDDDFGNATYAIDHIQFLVRDVKIGETFFEKVFEAKSFERQKNSVGLQVADGKLILSKPEAFNLTVKDVGLRKVDGTIRIGLDHLGFLYNDVVAAVDQARSKKVAPIFQPQRYVYKGKPTVYTFSAFEMPENINIEMVQADGRTGPHSYYIDENNRK